MMKLRFGPASPFVRKVLVVAHETGQFGDLELVDQVMGDPEGIIGPENPLGKIPVLVTDEGETIFESALICEYLDQRRPGKHIVPLGGPERWPVMKLHALASGMTDAALLAVYESRRKEGEKSPDVIKRQKAKIRRALDALEVQAGEGQAATLPQEAHIGTIALGCGLGYLDLRFPGEDWRIGRPRLAAWHAAFARRPSMVATDPKTLGAR